jgi:hypothetical protein
LASKAHRVAKGLVGGWAILLGVIITGCAAPQYTYVANSGANTYFKVPSGWRQISPSALKTATGSSGGWAVAYEAGSKPTASNFLSFGATQPFAFAEVATLNSTTSNQMSYDMLRNSVLPVTSTARQSAAAQAGYPLTSFTQIRDQLLTPARACTGSGRPMTTPTPAASPTPSMRWVFVACVMPPACRPPAVIPGGNRA